MSSSTINYGDLCVAREIVPFLKLRFRMLFSGTATRPEPRSNTLVVVPCILGDCLSYLPAILTFAEQHQTPFDLLVSPDFEALARHVKGVRSVFLASSSYARPTERTPQSDRNLPDTYDQMLVLRLSPDAHALVAQVKCRRILSSDGALLKYVLHLIKSSLLKRPVRQSREIMFDALQLNGASREARLFNLFETGGDASSENRSTRREGGSRKRVLVHTGSGWSVKQWRDEHWVELVQRIDATGEFEFWFIGRGAEELQSFERIREQLTFPVYSKINALNLWELFLLMRESDYFVGIDSGPRNLAHYADLRSVTLLNPAAVKNFMPLDSRDEVIDKQNRFPANVVNTAPETTLEVITVDEVAAAFDRLVRRCQSAPSPVPAR